MIDDRPQATRPSSPALPLYTPEFTGRWVRHGGTIVVLADTKSLPEREEAYELSSGSIPSRKDLIHPRIDLYAQEALHRMFKGDPRAQEDASGMFAAVKAGRLAGIYIVNQGVPAMRARKMNTSFWELIRDGEDAILLLDPANLMAGPPLIAFRDSVKSYPSRLDPALRKAWKAFQMRRTGLLTQCRSPSQGVGLCQAGGAASSPAPCGPGVAVIGPFLQVRSGRCVGAVEGSNTNVKEDQLDVMDRLHLLWSMTNLEYDNEYAKVANRATGTAGDWKQIPKTIEAIGRNQQPTLHRLVSDQFLNLRLTDNVGRGQRNEKNDILLLQDSLRALKQLDPSDYATERAAILGLPTPTIPNPDATIPQTMQALSNLKRDIASGNFGWAPVRGDEEEGGGDRYGGQTFECGAVFSIFVPRCVKPNINKVHVYFSAGPVRFSNGFNDVLIHGLRGASDTSDWILIAVPRDEKTFRTISEAEVHACLAIAGHPGKIDSLRLSAHSRGYNGLIHTVEGIPPDRKPLVDLNIVERVVLLDANYGNIGPRLKAKGIAPKDIVAYSVVTPPLTLAGARQVVLRADCSRAIGYSRLIEDAMVTRPTLMIPSEVFKQLLPLPARGCFTTKSTAAPAPTCSTDAKKVSGCPPNDRVNILDFCKTNDTQIRSIVRRENGKPFGLKFFHDDNDLEVGAKFSTSVDSHRLFIAELAHEIVD